MLTLNEVTTPDKDYSEEHKKHQQFFLNHDKPQSFDMSDKDNAIVAFQKNYENEVILLSKYTNKDPKEMNLIEYYSLLEFVNNQNKKN